MKDKQEKLRQIPAVDAVMKRPEVAALAGERGRSVVVEAVRGVVRAKREAIVAGGEVDAGVGVKDILDEIGRRGAMSLRRVVNATGVVLHTNLGRAPLPAAALDALREAASGYCNLEYRVAEGARGSRYEHVEALLCALSGAAAAHVVNNNAAAVFLAAAALARGRRVVVSRGELVEIGEGFRLPDIIAESGAELVEVGATNRTNVDDYAAALDERAALVVKAHRSNFFMEGFVEEVGIEELVALARSRAVPVLYDIGSGALALPSPLDRSREPLVAPALASGADLVTFSADKLLGGPQAGIILGDAGIVRRLRAHPLTRALRPCKVTLALLERLLLLYRDRRLDEIPLLEMLGRPPARLRRDARRLARMLTAALASADWSVEAAPERAPVGGGSLPRESLESWVVRVAHRALPAATVEERLRRAPVPVVARIRDGRVVVDPRTLRAGELALVVRAFVGV